MAILKSSLKFAIFLGYFFEKICLQPQRVGQILHSLYHTAKLSALLHSFR